MMHAVLLGDSIFDNAVYVPGGPSVIEQLRELLPTDWQVTLLAIDGDVTEDVHAQLANLPPDATHLIVSVGGNDALGYLSVLSAQTSSVAGAFEIFSPVRADFRAKYRAMITSVVATGRDVSVCTVYDCVPGLELSEQIALSTFNEVILREAIDAGVDLIDLRLICTDSGDYSELSPIEPSVQGGEKIARVISERLLGSSIDANVTVHI